MQERKLTLTVFYCHHQAERVASVVKEGNESGGIDFQKIALPCSGKLEVFHITQALEKGAGGVAVFGCPEEECRYVVGSPRAAGRIRYTQKILKAVGLEEDRVRRFIPADDRRDEETKAFAEWAGQIQTRVSLAAPASPRMPEAV